jgi:hypothetical protein
MADIDGSVRIADPRLIILAEALRRLSSGAVEVVPTMSARRSGFAQPKMFGIGNQLQ